MAKDAKPEGVALGPQRCGADCRTTPSATLCDSAEDRLSATLAKRAKRVRQPPLGKGSATVGCTPWTPDGGLGWSRSMDGGALGGAWIAVGLSLIHISEPTRLLS